MRYLIRFFITFALVATLIIAIKWLVDPYAIFGAPVIEGINDVKPFISRQEALFKAELAKRSGTALIVLGNSRVNHGISLEGLDAAYYPALNLGAGGQSYQMSNEMLDRAYIHSPSTLKDVVFFVDFFGNTVSSKRNDHVPGRAHKLKALFTSSDIGEIYSTFAASYKGDAKNEICPDQYVLQTGWNCHYPIKSKVTDIDRLYREEKQYCEIYKDMAYDPASPFSNFSDIVAMAELADAKSLKFFLVIPPLHVRQVEMIAIYNRWGQWEKFKHDLTALSGRFPNMEVWDFSELSLVNTQPFYDKQPHDYYFESTHFKKNVGDKIMTVILKTHKDSPFGIRLTSANIEGHLIKIRAQYKDWLKNHKQEAEKISNLCH